MPDITEKKKYINFLVSKQKIDYKKNKFFLFDYSSSIHIKEKLVKEIVDDNYLGIIPYSTARTKGMYKNYALTRYMRKRDMIAYFKLFNKLREEVL